MTKTGPKRRRHTRRELPYGQKSLWGNCHHMKRDRERQFDRDTARINRKEGN